MTGEAVVDRLCPWGGEDFGERPLKKIAQRQISIGIETAGNYRSVHQHADLISETVAKEGRIRR